MITASSKLPSFVLRAATGCDMPSQLFQDPLHLLDLPLCGDLEVYAIIFPIHDSAASSWMSGMVWKPC